MKKKIITAALALMLSLHASIGLAATHSSRSSSIPTTSPRAGTFSTNSSNSSSHVTTHSQSSSGGFSGGASNKSTVPGNPSSSSTGTKGGTAYSSGRSYYGGSTYSNTVPSGTKPSSFWPMAGAFAAGTFLGSMLHPMGGYYPAGGGGYVHQPFSFMPLLLDIIAILFIIWFVSLLFRSLRGRRG
ncbi:hypothetical protein O9H85_11595 [Paenibacillus filicis]|uniref:Uncharacterized protein n=1 Tax=Paenibacillus gyeongsangnamensis TaxID=3388067 RepID=A0ABT4Q8N3_9BACL|nr:hypothetical protein [Paenibacillus filicis]MCZ8513055.1 hypothetical protein [Paenibacillus filicis]